MVCSKFTPIRAGYIPSIAGYTHRVTGIWIQGGNYVRYRYNATGSNYNPASAYSKHGLATIYANDGRRLDFTEVNAYTWDVTAAGGSSPVRRRYYARERNFQVVDENDERIAYAFERRSKRVGTLVFPEGGNVNYDYSTAERVDYLTGATTRLPMSVRLIKRTTSDGAEYEFSSNVFNDTNEAGEPRAIVARVIKTPTTLLEYRLQKSERNEWTTERAKTAAADSGRLISFRNHGYIRTWSKDLVPAYQRDYQWHRLPALADLDAIFSARFRQGETTNFPNTIYLPTGVQLGEVPLFKRPWAAYFDSYRIVLKREVTRYFPPASRVISFSKNYSGWDGYGNPQRLVESSNDGQSRQTDTTYWRSNAASRWIVGLPATSNTALGSGRGNNVVSYSYQENGLPSRVNRNGIITGYSYHGDGNLRSKTDAEGHAHSYEDYFRGVPRLETNRNGDSKIRRVDADGTLTYETSWGGAQTWRYRYDNKRRLRQTSTPGQSFDINIEWLSPVHQKETQGDRTTETRFDGFGREVFTTTYDATDLSNRITIMKRYDSQGRLIFTSLPNKMDFRRAESFPIESLPGTRYVYDGLGRLVETRSIQDGNASTAAYGRVRYRYNLDGFSIRTNDGRGKWRSEWLHAFGSPEEALAVRIMDTDAHTTISIERDKLGRPLSTTRGGLRRVWHYSSTTQLLYSQTNPEHGETIFRYYNDGRVRQTSNQNRTSNYTYTPDNQIVTGESAADGKQIRQLYSYNPRGLLEKLETQSSGYPVDQQTFVSYQYDDDGNLVNETLDAGGRSMGLRYSYDGHGSLKSILYPTGKSYDMSPDPLGRSRKIVEIGGSEKTVFDQISYHANGLVSRATRPNITMSQNIEGRTGYPRDRITTGRDDSNRIFRRYFYDESLNIQKIQDLEPRYTLDLGYDNQNRLTYALSAATGRWQFSYDGRDNISSIDHNGAVSSYYYNSTANRLDRVETSGQRRSFQYDSRGNITNNGNSNIRYMANDHIVAVDNETYVYDGNGRRALTQTASGNRIYQLYGQGGRLRYRYDAGAQTHSEYHYVAGKLLARRDTGNSAGSSSGGDGSSGSSSGSSSGGTGGAPTAPTVSGQAHSQTAIEIQWTASTDADGSIDKYEIHRNGEFAHRTLGRSWWQEGLTPGTDYEYAVFALDNDGNPSSGSSSSGGSSNSPPSPPQQLSGQAHSQTAIEIRWSASTDGDGSVDKYEIYRNGEYGHRTQGLSWWQEGLTPGTSYTYQVYAIDNDGGRSSASVSLELSTPGSNDGGDSDNGIPTSPIVSGQAHSQTAIEIQWDASTDSNGSIDRYEIYRNGEHSHHTQGRSWWQEGLTPDTEYRYEVVAIDNDGNRSAPSSVIAVRTNP